MKLVIVCSLLICVVYASAQCTVGYNQAVGQLGSETNTTKALRLSTFEETIQEGPQRYASISRYGSLYQGNLFTHDNPLKVALDDGSKLHPVAILESFGIIAGGSSVSINTTSDIVGEIQLRFLGTTGSMTQVIVPLCSPGSATKYMPLRGFVPSFVTDVIGLVVSSQQGQSPSGWARVLPLLPTPTSGFIGGRYIGWVANPPCFRGGITAPTYILPALPIPLDWANTLAAHAATASVATSVGIVPAVSIELPYYVDAAGGSASTTSLLNMIMRRNYENEVNVRMESAIVALVLGILAAVSYIVVLVLVRKDVITIPTWMGGKRLCVDFWVNPRVVDERGELLSSGSVVSGNGLSKHRDAVDESKELA